MSEDTVYKTSSLNWKLVALFPNEGNGRHLSHAGYQVIMQEYTGSTAMHFITNLLPFYPSHEFTD